MTPVHIIGQPGSGKTTLVASLVRHFCDAGLSVGTLKHSSHSHELDKPGKDTHVLRTAGANPAAMVTGAMAAVFLPRQSDPQALIDTYFNSLDLVLIEGWISGPHPKIEVWRAAVGRLPLFSEVKRVTALVTDDALDGESRDLAQNANIPILPLQDLESLAAFIRTLAAS